MDPPIIYQSFSYCAIRREDGNVCSIRRLYIISAILIYCTTYSCCVLYNYTDRKSTKCTKMGEGCNICDSKSLGAMR